MLIASSTLVPWTPPRWTSFSVRPRHGRISARLPCTRWLRLSFVLTCTVSSVRRSASIVIAVSGAASTKLPPMPTKTFTSPRCIASIVRTVSRPCSRGGSMPQTSASLSRNCLLGAWLMPQVRLPWTFECPRIGDGPAPGRPTLPRSSSRLTISRIVSTPCSCWVRPRHQETIVRSAPRRASRPAASSPRPRPTGARAPPTASRRRAGGSPRARS